MIGIVSWATFFAILAGFAAWVLFRNARRTRSEAALRRRLGGGYSGSCESAHVEQRSDSIFAQLAARSGLGWSGSMLLTRTMAAGVGALLVGAVLGGPVVAVLLAIPGLFIFPFVAQRAAAKRAALCEAQLPQALEVIVLALRAGHSLPKAIAISAQEAPSPIGQELQRVVGEHELGAPLEDALAALARRFPSSTTLQAFVAAVALLVETGGDLVDVVGRIVGSSRARTQYEAKARALTAEGRSSAKILGALPIAMVLMMALVSPRQFTVLIADPWGNVLLALAAGAWMLGLLWMRSLVKVER